MVKSGERIRKRVTITTVYVRDYAVNPSYHYNTIQHSQTNQMHAPMMCNFHNILLHSARIGR